MTLNLDLYFRCCLMIFHYFIELSRIACVIWKLFSWSQNWPRLGPHMFNISGYRENMKKTSRLKPQGIEP